MAIQKSRQNDPRIINVTRKTSHEREVNIYGNRLSTKKALLAATPQWVLTVQEVNEIHSARNLKDITITISKTKFNGCRVYFDQKCVQDVLNNGCDHHVDRLKGNFSGQNKAGMCEESFQFKCATRSVVSRSKHAVIVSMTTRRISQVLKLCKICDQKGVPVPCRVRWSRTRCRSGRRITSMMSSTGQSSIIWSRSIRHGEQDYTEDTQPHKWFCDEKQQQSSEYVQNGSRHAWNELNEDCIKRTFSTIKDYRPKG